MLASRRIRILVFMYYYMCIEVIAADTVLLLRDRLRGTADRFTISDLSAGQEPVECSCTDYCSGQCFAPGCTFVCVCVRARASVFLQLF